MKSSIIGKRNFATISILLALALINFIAIPPALAQCMLTPFQPPVGLIEFQVQPEMLTNMTQNGFTIRRTIDTPSTIQYTVDRVDQSSFTFLRNRGADTPNEIGAFTVSAAFVGQHGLLFTVRDGGLALKNPTREAVFFDLSQPNPAGQQLYFHEYHLGGQDFVFDAFFANADQSCLLTFVHLSLVSESDEISEIRVFRTDTGAELCSLADQKRDLPFLLTAEVLDLTSPAGSDTVRLSFEKNGSTVASHDCPLPVPGPLTVQPQPLAFGSIPNNTTKDLSVSFSNPGEDPVQVTALTASANYAPVNFSPFTLQGGETVTRTIRFTPGGINGQFDQNLAITRCPAVGAAIVNCTGKGITAVTVTALNPSISESQTAGVTAFRVSRLGNLSQSLTVNLTTGGSAVSGTSGSSACDGPDYLQLPSSVMIASQSDHVDLQLVPFDDEFDSDDKTVILNVAAGVGYDVGSPSGATVSILDDDPAPLMTIVGRSFLEGQISQNIVVADVALSSPSKRLVTVDWAAYTSVLLPTRIHGLYLRSTARGGTNCAPFGALSGPDFLTSSGQLTFPACTTAGVITVPICGNTFCEPDESFFIGLSSPIHAALDISSPNSVFLPGYTRCTILNDDLCASWRNIQWLNGAVVLTLSNHVANGTDIVLTSTNLNLPLANWTPVWTNTFNSSANLVFTNAITSGVPMQFYALQVVQPLVVFDNFDPEGGFHTQNHLYVAYAAYDTWAIRAAARFTVAEGDFRLTSVSLPIANGTFGATNNLLRVRLTEDNGGAPGATLEVLSQNQTIWPTLSDPFTNQTTLFSVAQPLLSEGSNYWIVTEPTAFPAGGSVFVDYRWFYNTSASNTVPTRQQWTSNGTLPSDPWTGFNGIVNLAFRVTGVPAGP